MGDEEISEYGEVFDLSMQLICINSSSSYFFKVTREGYDVYYNDDKGDVKDYSHKMIKKLSFDKKEKYRQDITNAYNDFVHNEAGRKTENQPIHSLFVKNVCEFYLMFTNVLHDDILNGYYSNNDKSSKGIDETTINDKDVSLENSISYANGKRDVDLDEEIIFYQLKEERLILRDKMKDGKYLAKAKMPAIGRCIIRLLEGGKIKYPKRENVWQFIKDNILDDMGEEFKGNVKRQNKHLDKKLSKE